jgi:hypothetical protein
MKKNQKMKALLEESTMRRWNKLSGSPISEKLIKELYGDEEDEELPPSEDTESEIPAPEPGEEPVPEEPGAEASAVPEEEREEILADVVRAVADELGIEAEVEGADGGEEDEIPETPEELPDEEELPPAPPETSSPPEEEKKPPIDEAKKTWPAKDPAAGAKWQKAKKVQEALVSRVVERVIRRLVKEAKEAKVKSPASAKPVKK